MQLEQKPDIDALFRHVTRADAFIAWLREEGDVLVSAAALLGGEPCAAKAEGTVTTARQGGNVAARRTTLVALRGLLEGAYADQLDRDEAWRFAALHPDAPDATRAMRCADALGRGIRAFEAVRLAGVNKISGGV